MSTEAEAEAAWITCTDPRPMLSLLQGKARERKFRLFACACCRRVDHLITDDRCRRAIELIEQFHDGQVTRTAYDLGERMATEAYLALTHAVAANESRSPPSITESVRLFASMIVAQAVADCFRNVANTANGCRGAFRGHGTANITDDNELRAAGEQIDADECAAQAALVRDIFGNPFRPVAFNPAWRTDTASALARQIYESREFSVMPILADAIQDAGCDNDDVLNHCRDANTTHTRGCWVVDMILGKM